MADAKDGVEKYIDTKMLVTMVVVFFVIVALVMLYQYYNKPQPPSGSISPADYNALTADLKATYKLDPAGSGYYVKIS